MAETVNLRDRTRSGDCLILVGKDKNPLWHFVADGIRLFSRSKGSHVEGTLSPDRYFSMTTPRPQTEDDKHLLEVYQRVIIRRPVWMDEAGTAKAEALWAEILKGGDYDELQIAGMMVAKTLEWIGLHPKSPFVEFDHDPKKSVCSATYSYIATTAWRFDPVPLEPDSLTDPGQLERTRALRTIEVLENAGAAWRPWSLAASLAYMGGV